MPFELDDFQMEANEALEADSNVLVPPGSMQARQIVADFAIYLAQERNVRRSTPTPIKALSNQKYHDLMNPVWADQYGPAYRRYVHQFRGRYRGRDHRSAAQHVVRTSMTLGSVALRDSR